MNEIVETLQGMLADCRAIHRDPWSSVARLESRFHKVCALFKDVEYPNKEQRHAMRELCDYCEEFLEQTERLEDDFLFTLNRKHKHRDAREGTIERDDPRLPAGILAGRIIDAIEAFSDPVVVPATPAIVPSTPAPVASAPWFAGAKPLEQEILSKVDEKLAGSVWPCDFTEFIWEKDPPRLFDPRKVQRLAGSMNRILEKAGKPCRFSAPDSAKELILIATGDAQPRSGPRKSKSKRRKTK